ncbi:MAG: hypothetical protein ACPG8W_06605 [Candidatus Promineifilaceae bacterium]
MHEDPIFDALDKLDGVKPNSAEIPSARAQLARFKAQQPSTQLRSTYSPQRRTHLMNNTRKYAMVGLFVAIFVGAFAFIPQARALASDFLGIFRVSKFAPISVSPQQLEMLSTLGEDGIYPGEFEFTEGEGEMQEFDNLGDALVSLGDDSNMFGLRTNYALGDPNGVYVMPGGSGKLTVNLENARALLEAAGIDPQLLPDSMDGQDIAAEAFPSVAQDWDNVMLMQMASPVVNYPVGVNPQPIGEALLQLLGMEEAEAQRVAASIDWTNTLLLPVPTEFATFAEVQVDGTVGLALEPIDGSGEAAIVWQSGGMLYFLTGYDMGVEDLLDIAAEMSWWFNVSES